MSQETLKIELGHWDIGTFGDINCLAKASQDEIRFVILPLNSLNLGSKMFYSMRGIYWYPYIEIQGLKSGQNPCFELMSQCPTGPWILIWDIGTFRDINWVPPPGSSGRIPRSSSQPQRETSQAWWWISRLLDVWRRRLLRESYLSVIHQSSYLTAVMGVRLTSPQSKLPTWPTSYTMQLLNHWNLLVED